MAEMEMIFVPGTGIIEDKVVPHCGDCYWFDEDGYENPDPELPELRTGFIIKSISQLLFANTVELFCASLLRYAAAESTSKSFVLFK